MSTILTHDEISSFGQAIFESPAEFVTDAEITKTSIIRFENPAIFEPLGEVEYEGEAVFDHGDHETVMQGFLTDEPNVFGDAIFESIAEFVADVAVSGEGLAIFETAASFQAVGERVAADVSRLSMICTIVDSETPVGQYIWQRGRFQVDGVDIPFISASYGENETRIGGEVSITLLRPSDLDVVINGSQLRYGIGDYKNGSWSDMDWLLTDAVVKQRSVSIGRADNKPTDTVQITLGSRMVENLMKTAQTDLFIYDPDKIPATANTFVPHLDTTGRTYPAELVPIYGMSLHALLNEVLVNRCGFDRVIVNIADHPLTQRFIPMGNELYGGLTGPLGAYAPILVEDGENIVVKDTTMIVPVGLGPVRYLTPSQYLSMGHTKNESPLEAYRIRFIHNVENYDISTVEEMEFDPIPAGEGEGYTETRRWVQVRNFSKSDAPGLILQTVPIKEIRETTDFNGDVIHRVIETYVTDAAYNLLEQRALFYERVPAYPYTETSGFTFELVKEEYERFEWDSYQSNPDKPFIRYRVKYVTGLITIDSNNKQLGQDYKRDVVTAYRSGNLKKGMEVIWGAISTLIEESEPLEAENLLVRVLTIDHLSNVGSTDVRSQRVGNVSNKTFRARQKIVLMFPDDSSERSVGRITDLLFGETPPEHAFPLARRKLRRQRSSTGTFSHQLPGHDRTLRRAEPITALNREGEEAGNFIITDRTINCDRTGVFSTINGRQI